MKLYVLLVFVFVCNSLAAQTDSTVFERITKGVQKFKPDTSNVPDDKITRTIIELLKVKGDFNINEAIAFKLEEDRQKKDI
ncbi:MAG: hypothetical protein C4329_12790 [Chitinophagaceae bacterium]